MLSIEETSVTGAPRTFNTFDQNVPGFSITFLLLGMLLGISLALLDEADWGTFDRLRATPTPLAAVLGAKLMARFVVGMVQMALLFAVGRLFFGVSLGPEPCALALPTVGIVAAGAAFGLVVAGLAQSREAVLPLGSIAILSMAAVGGCWWPIDLEPRWMQSVARAFPTFWAMDAFNDLMIRRQTASAGPRRHSCSSPTPPPIWSSALSSSAAELTIADRPGCAAAEHLGLPLRRVVHG
jgi:ABC-type multidrug transport system permease subunit